MSDLMQITIYGASDDLVEVEGGIREEFNIYRKADFLVAAPNGDCLAVTAEYGAFEWELTVSANSDIGYPSWPIHFGERPGREGDPAIFMAVPVGTTITQIGADDDEH